MTQSQGGGACMPEARYREQLKAAVRDVTVWASSLWTLYYGGTIYWTINMNLELS